MSRDPFGDLDAAVEDEDGAGTESADGSSAESGGSAAVDPLSEPAFPWDKKSLTKQIYPREETWSAFDDLLFDVEYALRREHGVEDPSNRELHDAALRAFLNGDGPDPDEIARRFVDARRAAHGAASDPADDGDS